MRNTKTKIAGILLGFLCIISGMFAVRLALQQKQEMRKLDEIQELAGIDEKETRNNQENDQVQQQETQTGPVGYENTLEGESEDRFWNQAEQKTADQTVEIPVDFAALQEVNPEIYAWLVVPGTDIDYPVVQHQAEGENSFYLDHNYQQEWSPYGAIYSEKRNSQDFSNPMTVLYGHNMRDGSMFASLHRFEDRDFFDANREFYIYTPQRRYRYLIFAAYTFTNRHILNTYDFSTSKGYRDYINEIYEYRSMTNYFLNDPMVTTADKIVTLSTCRGADHSVRYLVQGMLIGE